MSAVKIFDVAPDGLHSITRGAFESEKAAVRAAKRYGGGAIVVAQKADRFHEACWYVGHAPGEPGEAEIGGGA